MRANLATLLVALLLGLAATWFLNSESALLIHPVILGLAGVTTLLFAVVFTYRHREWLPAALVLTEANLAGVLELNLRSAVHYGLLGLFCIPCIPSAWKSKLWRSGSFRLYAIYFLWALLSLSWSIAPAFSIARWTGSVLEFCAITAITADLRNGRDVSLLAIRYLQACGLLVVVLALSAILLPRSITWSNPTDLRVEGEISRFQGIFDNPNAVGGLMLDTVAPILAFWTSFRRQQKIILSLVMVLALGLGALADSRSPFVALGFGGLLYILWRYRAKGFIALIGVVVLVVAALPISSGLMSKYVHGRDVGTLTGRTEIWAFAIHELRQHPIRGYGYAVAGAIFQSRYFTEWYGPWDEGSHSSLHNGYLAEAVGLGVPAAIFWLCTLVMPFVFLFKRKDDPWNLRPAVFLIIIPILTLNLSEVSLVGFLGFDGILFGLIWGGAEMYRRSILEKEEAAQGKLELRTSEGTKSTG